MAAVSKNGTPSLATMTPSPNCWVGSNLVAGEDIGAWDACYIKGADGKVWRSNGTAATEPSKVHGFAPKVAKAGAAVSLLTDVDVNYGSGLTPGASYYLMTTAGALSTIATTGGTTPIAFALDATRIRVRQFLPVGV